MPEILMALAVICGPEKSKAGLADCENYIKTCIEWVSDQPQVKEKGFTKGQIALWLIDKDARVKVCR